MLPKSRTESAEQKWIMLANLNPKEMGTVLGVTSFLIADYVTIKWLIRF